MTAGLLNDLLTNAAATTPQATAIVQGSERLSYGELDAASNRLAYALLEAGCRPGDRVCLLAPKTPGTIVALLATLKAGGVYVPIDIAAPVARSAAMIAAVQPAAVFLAPEAAGLHGQLREAGALPPAVPALSAADGDGRPEVPQAPARRPADPAQILFTSGSTGRPKGVVVTHASVAAFIEWAARHFAIAPGERCSALPPLHFDLSTFDLFGALAARAQLHLPAPETILPRQIADYIAGGELQQLFCVPSMLAYLSAHGALPAGGFPALRRILWCGEVLALPVLIEWMERHPWASFTNLYGPTEATIASSYHTVTEIPTGVSEPVPIGTACPGEELLVLGEELEPLRDGELGELAIAGVGLSPGYWREPELTAAAFVADPRPGHAGERVYRTGDYGRRDRDGVLHFHGRRDTQIKSRGYRIELGEIEAALCGLPEVAECAVVGVATDRFEGVSICGAVVAAVEELTAARLRTLLRERLPAYMLPARWELVPALPKNGNGKIDRVRVRELFAGAVLGSGAR